MIRWCAPTLSQRQSKGKRQQLKQTIDTTSLWWLCCRASVVRSGKVTLDVASRAPEMKAEVVAVTLLDVVYEGASTLSILLSKA